VVSARLLGNGGSGGGARCAARSLCRFAASMLVWLAGVARCALLLLGGWVDQLLLWQLLVCSIANLVLQVARLVPGSSHLGVL